MKSWKLLIAVAAMGLAWDATIVSAAPTRADAKPAPAAVAPAAPTGIEAAKKALAEKRYDDVDVALARELATKLPDPDALHVSLSAALASGKMVTANQRASELLKATAGHDLEVLFASARTAEAIGDSRTAQVRYLAYARQTEKKSPQLEFALDYVLRHEAYPEEYKKSVKLYGADGHAWRFGLAQLARLIDAGDGDRTLDLAGFLVDNFPEADQLDKIYQLVQGAAESYVFGKEPKDRYLKPLQWLAKRPAKDMRWIESLISTAAPATTDEIRVQIDLDIMAHSKSPLSINILNQLASDLRGLKSQELQARAATAVLAAAPAYAAADKDQYFMYLRLIAESPTVFHAKDNTLVSNDAIQQLCLAFVAKYPDDLYAARQLMHWVESNYLGSDTPVRIAFLQKHVPLLFVSDLSDLVSFAPQTNIQALVDKWAAGKPFKDVLDTRVQLIASYNTTKDKAGLLATAKDYLAAYPTTFNKDLVNQQVIGSTLLDSNDKLALLKDAIAQAGYADPMKQLLDTMGSNKATWAKDAGFIELRTAFNQKPVGKDPAAAALVALADIKLNPARPDPSVLATVSKFLAGYKGTIPAGDEKQSSIQEILVQQIWTAHGAHVWNNPAGVSAFAELWAPRTPLGSNWEKMTSRVQGTKQPETLAKLAQVYIAAVRAAGPASGNSVIWRSFFYFAARGERFSSALPNAYDLMGGDLAVTFVVSQARTSDNQTIANELAKALAANGGKLTDPVLIRNQMNNQWSLVSSAPVANLSPEVTKAVWKSYLADLAKGGSISPIGEARIYATLNSGHKAEAAAFLADYLKLLETRTLQQRLDALSELFHWSEPPRDQTPYALTPGSSRTVLLKTVAPLFEEVSPRDYDAQTIEANALQEISALAAGRVPEKEADAKIAAAATAQRAEARKLARVWGKMIAAGSRLDAPISYMFGVDESLCNEALAAKDGKALADAVQTYGDLIARDNSINDQTFTLQIAPLIKSLEDAGQDEAIYILVSNIQHGKPIDSVSRQLMIAKAKSATRIKGLIPVPPTDVAYDLYMASASLMGGDESKAWELTAPKLKLLIANWEGFDVRYVAWTVDQMRKQKMLKEALEFSFTILLHESDLEPETAGKVLLSQSDIYKDMENYQAARVGFESLKNNNRYTKTEAGQKAVYRLIELHILTKDYTAAETLLERMADADDVNKQAEAYYLYAEMAFHQGQYKEAKAYLKKVKDRIANHVEAALLEGELNLILPGGLANTEVAVGDPRLSTVVIPGRFLQLELQDPNLSIARGGAAIPVIVTTSKGGDVEHVKLLPSSGNKTLFTARIATALGKAVKDNLTLELVGDDVVSYVIDPEFQKANDLNYPPKVLEVREDARLVASSGEILSEEEEEKRELERQLRRREVIGSRQLDIARDGRTIRPGSPVYVQVSDSTQSLHDVPDTVKVDLRTSSGESLENFSVTETSPHTGVFRAAVPTGIPQPKVYASDADDSKDPQSAIHPGTGDGWVSQADGRKDKWVEVDTMSSHEVSSVTMEIPHLDTVKDISLLGMLADDYEELASLPPQTDAANKGGVQVETAVDRGGETVELIRRRLKLALSDTIQQDAPFLIRESTPLKTKAPNGTNAIARLRGSFYLGENRSIELQYMQPYEGYILRSHVLIDGQEVLGNFSPQTAQLTSRVELVKGAHTLEILMVDNHSTAKVIVGYRQPDGSFIALPADWFSVKSHPELAEALRPKGRLTVKGDLLTATFEKPVRLRKVRAQFRDFTGAGISVKQITVTDAAGKAVVPIAASEAGSKAMLRIAPGDQITVSYTDTRRLHGETKVLTKVLNSSYYNGTITLAEEKITANPNNPQDRLTEFLEAKRCRLGDQMMIVVTDYDEDTTDARDTVDVKVTTSSGETLSLKALETAINRGGPEQEAYSAHAGQFLAVLKFGSQTKGDTIKVNPGDSITVSYTDRENTNPGIPVDRTYTVNEAGSEAPRLTVYRTSVKMVPDISPDAKARLKRLVGRETKGAVLYKPQTVARHPDYVPLVPATQPTRKEIVASVEAPLLFEVAYPRRALNSGSILEVTAVAESELQAAAKEKREPVVLKVPTYIQDIERLAQIKGYPIQLLSSMRRDAKAMLKSGEFSGVIRLQVGSKGDPIDDLVLNGEFISESQRLADPEGLYYKVPTLLVNGSDVVHIRVKDESTGKEVDTPIRLLSDGRLDLLDSTYMIANESIHLGEKFHVRITDADHDISNERDSVSVKVAASSGSETVLTLTETLPHSGVFTGTLEPQYIKDPATTRPSTQPAEAGEATLKVNFGDTLTFTYIDDLTLDSTSPVTVVKTGKILLGSDAEVVSFTKKFKDPEIAVKTRFLMAEALFEMAKEHRKIGQMKQADDEIVRGKNILDEAIRDYPNTSLAPQGEYLLANLAQELTNYQEAVGRYANVISTWPDSEYAAGSQFKQALCYEKMGKNDQAVEEYVKLTYLYPDSPLVADATIRLGNYYLKQNSFKTAGKIFSSFATRNPAHRLAPQSLFLAAQCAYKQADYKESVELFGKTADTYPDEKALRPEAMYWLADSATKINDNVKAFRTFKKITWDYPESEWAKAARGRLTEEVFSRMQEQEQ